MSSEEEFPDFFRGDKQLSTRENVALIDAVKNGDESMTRAALTSGAEANYFDRTEIGLPTGLHAAAANGDVNIAKVLIQHGSAVDVSNLSNGNTALHQAAFSGSKDVCQLLVDAMENPEQTNHYGNTPMHTACRVGSLDVIKFLISKGGDVNAVNNRGSTALHFCAFLCDPNTSCAKNASGDAYLQIAETVIQAKANVNVRDANGYAPLHIAAQRGCIDLARLLLDHGGQLGCKTNSSDGNELTAIEIAESHDQHEMVKYLQQRTNPAASERLDLDKNYPAGSAGAAFVKRL
mmetsp:Transcript_6891/g.10280  ORF Transcript_6891/g.10280 Transcript_6891/m.10280 type:complete len:292 (-) Transcript_6891:505-1380(-)|eukprot:CAMPEP_0116024082 /NCGR_PEP_ID=MMETSP0321-20121206/12075_1 /TAXON_ID=163516 /ORGANISM="Leptocylindrus danicus var. danicus, Strain B650" /LENGTH=291 /DNA_ID=CAMNT_0003495685 /DNA_START=767 /DNA_END=1642 /DNA_ORIENTATION=-